jgi:outer membrane protein assembly factor BamB
MMKIRYRLNTLLSLSLGVPLLLPFASYGQDWPQWNGPNRDGRLASSEGLNAIPKDGLPLLWKQTVGLGYSGPVAASGRVFVSDYELASGKITNNPGTRDRLTGKERIRCFDGKSGDLLWTHAYDRPYALSYPGGPRATPVVTDGMVVALGAEGDLVCLSADDGKVLWQKNLPQQYKTQTPIWGQAAVPLVVGDQLLCMAGGPDSLVVSLDRKTGKENWRALSGADIGYCPPSLINCQGVEQLIIWAPERISSLNPTNGSIHWQQPFKPDYGMSVAPPILCDNLLFASGEGISAMFEIQSKPPGIQQKWRGTTKTSLGLTTTVAIHDNGYIYGADYQSGALVCVRVEDGVRMWQTALATTGVDRPRGVGNGTAYLIKADTFYYILSETGDILSAKLTPAGYEETGRFHAIDPTNTSSGRSVVWTFPAIADGKLLVRNDKEIRCYDLKSSSR